MHVFWVYIFSVCVCVLVCMRMCAYVCVCAHIPTRYKTSSQTVKLHRKVTLYVKILILFIIKKKNETSMKPVCLILELHFSERNLVSIDSEDCHI